MTYMRVNCLKTIPLRAAHTYIAHICQYLPPPELSPRVNKNRIKIYVLKERAAKVENSSIQLPGLLSSCEERRVLEWSTRLVLKKQQKQTILSQSIGKEINSYITGLGHQHGRRFIREFKQQWRQQRLKRHLKCEVALFQSLWCLCDLVQFVKCWQIFLAPVVQPLDSAIHRIKIYSADNAIGFPSTYPLDSDLSGG